jgi:hypothetical protein
MKIFVEHDDSGRIRSVALPASVLTSQGVNVILRLLPAPGFMVSEVEAPQVLHDRHFDALRDVKRSHRVEGHPHQSRLVQSVDAGRR